MFDFLEGIFHLNGSVDSVIGHVKLHCIVGAFNQDMNLHLFTRMG